MTPDTGTAPPRSRREATVVIRALESLEDLRGCVDLQRRTWGDAFGEIVPPSMMKVATHVGGVAAGAFDEDDALVGFVFGITGVEDGTIVHWSHMLGVLPRARNHGVGRRLKEHQRAAVASVGAKTIYWTFDPLVARNAHLNINKLGVRATRYVENMYGEGTSPLHQGIGTDRLIVAWPVSDAEVVTRQTEIARFTSANHQATRVEIPADIEALQRSDLASAKAWRERTRSELQKAFAAGLEVQGFHIDPAGRAYFLLGART